MTTSVGKHALYDLDFPIDSKILKNRNLMLDLMRKACLQHGATVLHEHVHKFKGGGFTFTIILAESHASAHTWPEHGIATVDIFMCGDCNSFAAMDTFVSLLRCSGHAPTKYLQTKVFRGFVNELRANTDADAETS